MILYAARRLLIAIPLLWAVLTLVFISIHLVPGDPVEIMLAGKASASTVAQFRHQLGLDQPLPVQYWNFLVHASHLDFGRSMRSNQPVWSEILQRWPFTLELAVFAMVLATLLALLQGVLAAFFNKTWLGTGIVGVTLLGVSIPDFWLGTMLALVFGVRLGWLPVQGTGSIRNLVLPSLTLAIGISAILARVIRTSLVDVLSSEYILVARAKGLLARTILFVHAVRNALVPVLTVYGLIVAYLLSGAVIVENVFSWPGLGTYVVGAVSARDFPAIQGTTFFFALILILANLVVDILYAFVDPRIRHGRQAR